jgi:hypothetical protein
MDSSIRYDSIGFTGLLVGCGSLSFAGLLIRCDSLRKPGWLVFHGAFGGYGFIHLMRLAP